MLKVAIIGAGASGLTSIKSCLEEGLQPTCFEISSDIGGLWRYRDCDKTPDLACVFKSTVINTSKEVMAFSDFPPPGKSPNYMHNSQVLKYFRMYAEKFDLCRWIRFNTSVISVQRAEETLHQGKWRVDSRNGDGEEVSELFDAVMVCTGHHAIPNRPPLEGLDLFQGTKMHTHEYRKPAQFEDERVLVVGIGNSAGDAAVDLSHVTSKLFDAVMVCTEHHAIPNRPILEGLDLFQGTKLHTHEYRKPAQFEDERVLVVGIGNSAGDAAIDLSHVASKVFLSTRRGAWLMPRTGVAGLPGDLKFSRALSLAPIGMVNNILEKELQQYVDHNLYGLRPNHRPMSAHPTVNDSLPNRIANGLVIIKPDIKSFTATGVHFEDGSFEDIDAVILGTGFVIQFPFLSDKILTVDQNEVSLYKFVFPPDQAPPTLAVIGLIQPLGSTIPLAEMQARWAARIFKGHAKLPSRESMLVDIDRKRLEMRKRYITSQRHTIQVDFLPYMDEIAREIGVKPNFTKMFFRDTRFWARNVFGPALNYQFRLEGPGKWEGAREAIETYWERVVAPFGTRHVTTSPHKRRGRSVKLLIIPLTMLLISYWVLKRA